MAKRKKKRAELVWGLGALLLCGVVLLAVILLLPGSPIHIDPTPTTILPPNPYDEDDFAYDGAYLTCLTGESVLGLDVSSHQGVIDWQKVRAAGFEFVMIRVGYRGYESGLLNVDSRAQQNYEGARAAGLKVGAYFFSQAVNDAEAREEAAFVMDQIALWRVEMPVVFDWEYVDASARTAAMDKAALTRCTRAFVSTVEAAGYDAMVYFNPHLSRNLLDLEQLVDIPFWLALYTDQMTFDHRIQMWQYTQEGRIPGIEGNVDINLWLPYE